MPMRRDNFGGERRPIVKGRVSSAKPAEPMEMPFGMLSRVDQRNHVLDESAAALTGRGTFKGMSGLLHSIGFWELGKKVSCAKTGGPILTVCKSLTCFCTRRCFWRSRCDCSHLWGKILSQEKPPFLARIAIFKPNSLNIDTCMLSKLLYRYRQILHSDKYHKTLVMAGLNMHITNSRWRTAAILKK